MWTCFSLDYAQNNVYSKLIIKKQEWRQMIPKGNLEGKMWVELQRLFRFDSAVFLKTLGNTLMMKNFSYKLETHLRLI